MDKQEENKGLMDNNLYSIQSTSNFQIEEIEDDEFDKSFMYNDNTQNMSNILPIVKKNDDFFMRLPLKQPSGKSKNNILTGYISQILKWNQNSSDFQLYETIGIYASDWDSGNEYQRVLLVRQPRGPVLKVKIISCRYPRMPHCFPGLFLRIIGRINDQNLMVAYKITKASEVDYQKLERPAQICERIFKHRTS